MNEIEQAVLDAYASIGRQGTGAATNQIDPQGYAYWTNRAAQENLSPEQLKTMFNAEVGNYFQQKPTDPYTNYVSDYLVRDAYSNIGRTGIGDQPSNIDPEGYNFWVNKTINEGLTPDQLSRQFGAEVTQRLANSNVQTQPTVEQYVSNYLRGKSAPFVTLPAQTTGLRNLGVFGAAGNQMTSAGNAPYQSELIKSLRENNQQRLSTNPGVTMFGTSGGSTTPVVFNRPSGPMAFNPPRLSNQNSATTAAGTTGRTSGGGTQTGGGRIVDTGAFNGLTGSTINNFFGNEQVTDTGDETARLLTRQPINTSFPITQSGNMTFSNLRSLNPSVEVNQLQDVSNSPGIPWDAQELFDIDRELGNIQQSDVREVGTAAFPEDFGYVDPSNVPVVDRSVPSMSDANWGMASESLLPDWGVDAAFGIKSATENPIVNTAFPIASAVGGSLADATLDSQIDRLANQYAAIESGNNLGYGTRVDGSGAVFYEAPVETRNIFGGSYFSPESYFNAYDFGDLSNFGGGGGSSIGFGDLDHLKFIVQN